MGLFDFSFGFSNNQAQVGLNKEDTDWLYQRQSDRWRSNTDWFNLNGYSQMRAGLEKAGYNPLMALGSTPMSGATVSGSVMDERSNASSFNSSGIPLGFEAFRSQMRNVNADTNLKYAQTEENISRSSLENVQKILSDKEIPYKDRMLASSLLGIQLENEYKKQLAKNVSADTGLKITQSDLNRFQMNYYNALSNLSYSQKKHFDKLITKISQDIDLSSSDQQWLNSHPRQAAFLNYVKRYGSAIGSVLNPAMNAYNSYNYGKYVDIQGRKEF